MYRWPWRRFEEMFKRHLLRKAREELRQMRDLRIAAMDANMNFDSSENQKAKESRIEALQDGYLRAVAMLDASTRPKQPDPYEEAYESDPLFNPTARARLAEAERPLVEQAGMGRKLIEHE